MTLQLSVHGLEFKYSRHSPELYGGFSYDFEPAAITAACGESGRGKSTLLYILGLILTPSGGTIRYGDLELPKDDRTRSRFRAANVGFVFQDAVLDSSMSIVDSVCEPALIAGRSLNQARADADRLMNKFGVSHRRQARPGQISGGQAQRVALARALVNNPSVILADEPTGNLDDANAAAVVAALRDAANGGATVVVATHDPRILEAAHHEVQL